MMSRWIESSLLTNFRRRNRSRRDAFTHADQKTAQSPTLTIAGVDEVGRGALAGPVVCAAIVLPPTSYDQLTELGIRDSKKLSAKKRSLLYRDITRYAMAISLAMAPRHEVDQVNVRVASLCAMGRAVDALPGALELVLVDGRDRIPTRHHQQPLIGGDDRSISIAAASIIAKVTRDQLMQQLALHYPNYGFDRHVGYGTKRHRVAIARYGMCPEHRRSFRLTTGTEAASG